MSNTTPSGEDSTSSDNKGDGGASSVLYQHEAPTLPPAVSLSNNDGEVAPVKRKRNLPGTPDPDAEVIALSPRTLLATNRFVCEICNKGFQRDQNLQLHRRGHNLPWKLRQRSSKENRKRVYVCPEVSCVHHDASRALGDLTGIKKHYCRKHGEKKWKCEKCSKRYAVQSDWKAHSKTCGTREYRCDCGTLFSRRDSFVTHRAFCDALAEETARVSFDVDGNRLAAATGGSPLPMAAPPLLGNAVANGFPSLTRPRLSLWPGDFPAQFCSSSSETLVGGPQHLQLPPHGVRSESGQDQKPLSGLIQVGGDSSDAAVPLLGMSGSSFTPNGRAMGVGLMSDRFCASSYNNATSHTAQMSATALLQKAAQMGASNSSPSFLRGLGMSAPPYLARPPCPPSNTMASTLPQSGHFSLMKGFTDHYRRGAEGQEDGRSCDESTSLHELMNSLSAPAGMFGGMAKFPPLQSPSSSRSGSMAGGLLHSPFYNQMQGRNQKQEHSLMGGSSSGQTAAAGIKKVDDASRGRLTRDFLGVGGAMDMVGSLKSITASTRGPAGMDMNSFCIPADSLQQVGVASNLLETHAMFNN